MSDSEKPIELPREIRIVLSKARGRGAEHLGLISSNAVDSLRPYSASGLCFPLCGTEMARSFEWLNQLVFHESS